MDAVEFFKEKERMCKKYVINGDACMYTNCPIARELHSCIDAEDTVEGVKKMVEIVENWSKTHPVIELTEQQKTAIRGRIAEGYRWIVGWRFSDVVFSVEKPEQDENGGVGLRGRISYGDFLFFNFVKGNSIFYLPDLLGGEE